MFVRIKKQGKYQYLQVVENHRAWGETKQFVIANMGRLDIYTENENLEHVIRSLIKLRARIRISPDLQKISKKRRHRKP